MTCNVQGWLAGLTLGPAFPANLLQTLTFFLLKELHPPAKNQMIFNVGAFTFTQILSLAYNTALQSSNLRDAFMF